jgi:hypothetical protein
MTRVVTGAALMMVSEVAMIAVPWLGARIAAPALMQHPEGGPSALSYTLSIMLLLALAVTGVLLVGTLLTGSGVRALAGDADETRRRLAHRWVLASTIGMAVIPGATYLLAMLSQR